MKPMNTLAILAGSLIGLASAVVETGTQPNLSLEYLKSHSPPSRSQYRLPPTFSDTLYSPASYEATPQGWFIGTWYFYSSGGQGYKIYKDMQWTLEELLSTNDTQPTGALHDLTTGFLYNTSTLSYIYGTDKLIAPDCWYYQPTGNLSAEGNTWQILAWGYDSESTPFAVLWETEGRNLKTGGWIDFISRSRKGISSNTYKQILNNVKGLKNSVIDQAIDVVEFLPQDDRRDGTPYPSCNSTCMTNAYSYFWNGTFHP